MANLLPEAQRSKAEDNAEMRRIAGIPIEPFEALTEQEIAYRLDRFLRERPHITLTSEQIRKAFACALTLCPAVYIHPETLEWSQAELPSVAVMERAIAQAVRQVCASRPPTRKTNSEKTFKQETSLRSEQ